MFYEKAYRISANQRMNIACLIAVRMMKELAEIA